MGGSSPGPAPPPPVEGAVGNTDGRRIVCLPGSALAGEAAGHSRRSPHHGRAPPSDGSGGAAARRQGRRRRAPQGALRAPLADVALLFWERERQALFRRRVRGLARLLVIALYLNL